MMFCKKLPKKAVRFLWITAVATILIAAPTAPPAHADCATSASDNCVSPS
ncbi:hypothetical protein [Candidatus Leptofilum sp.]